MEASIYIKSSKEKENMCLFCGEPVEYGWVSDYKGTRVWICRNCVLEGQVGSLMASAILDKDEQDSEILDEINRCLETTQMKLYRNVLHYTFKHPSRMHKIGEGVKEKIEAAESKELKSEETHKIESKKAEPGVKSKEEKDRTDSDEDQLLKYLEDWSSIGDIQRQLKVGYKPLLEKLDAMYQKGKVDKRKVKIETGGHKYKYKKISEEGANDGNGRNESERPETEGPSPKEAVFKIGSDEVESRSSEGPEKTTSEPPNEDQLLKYLEDWKSIKDIQQQFNVGYNTLMESLNRLFFRGYLLKKTVPDNPMFKRAVSAGRA